MKFSLATFAIVLGGGFIALTSLAVQPVASANAAGLHRAGAPTGSHVCRTIVTRSGKHKRLCRAKPRIHLSAITIYNRRHCHSGGRCHKHRFANHGHRH